MGKICPCTRIFGKSAFCPLNRMSLGNRINSLVLRIDLTVETPPCLVHKVFFPCVNGRSSERTRCSMSNVLAPPYSDDEHAFFFLERTIPLLYNQPPYRTCTHHMVFWVDMEDTQKILHDYVEFYVELVQSVDCKISTTKTVRPTSNTPLEMVECTPSCCMAAVSLTGFDP